MVHGHPSQIDVWYDLSVINDGVLSDSYNLTTSNNIWSTTFWDETMTTQISSVGPLAADDTVAIKVKVAIPSTIYGDNDLCNARATSQANGAIFATTVVRTISAGQPVALPFYDAFTTTVVDPANWVQSSGITINTVERETTHSADKNVTPPAKVTNDNDIFFFN